MVEGFLEEMEMTNERERRRTWRELQVLGFVELWIGEEWFDEEEKEEESDKNGWNEEVHVVVVVVLWWRDRGVIQEKDGDGELIWFWHSEFSRFVQWSLVCCNCNQFYGENCMYTPLYLYLYECSYFDWVFINDKS